MNSLEQGLEFISDKNNIKQLVEEFIEGYKNTDNKEGYMSLDKNTLNKMKTDLDISRTMMSAQSGIWTIGLVIVVLLVIKETSNR